ncbi:YfjI family protein [Glycomyces dulcitolivorans]|uniref:YfjI family protein n=1 Tax=Glycomyces dulcitolivorans TaxID=2200759 RepID=UPI000DD4578A|nr:YfjI family protein [Glycomyces dulcitolivorans]
MKAKNPNHEAERAVLGAAMLSKSVVPAIATLVDAGSFDVPRHGLIWEAIAAQHAEGKPTEALAVAQRLNDEGNLAKAGGGPYLHDCLASVSSPASGAYYAGTVAEAAKRRELAAAGARIGEFAKGQHRDSAELLALSRAALDTLAGTGETWPAPVPLTEARTLPAFPAACLPDWVGDMVDAVAEATQTPADLAGSIALAALSTAVQGRLAVQAGPDWVEPANLFTCTALPPGNRKSSVFAAMVRPILDAEAELAEAARPRIIEAATEAEIARRAAEQALAAASKNPGDPDLANGAKSAAREADEVAIPVSPKLVADDITPEAAKSLLAEQAGRLAILSAEGGIFATIAGRYSGVPDLDAFLKGHAGDMLRVVRKSAPAEYVAAPALTLGLAVQPEVLRDAARMPGFEDRGLLARFLFTLPASKVGFRNPSPAPVPAPVKAAYARKLAGLVHSMHPRTDTVVLELTPEARDKVVALERDREPRLGPGGEWEPILSWANKWTGAVVRLAGLLHLAKYPSTGAATPVEGDTLDAATMLGYYFADHALGAWSYMGAGAETGPALALLDWLARHGQSGMSVRDMHRALRGRRGLATADAIRGAVVRLVEHGYLRERPAARRRGGRPPSPRYDLHPDMAKAGEPA